MRKGFILVALGLLYIGCLVSVTEMLFGTTQRPKPSTLCRVNQNADHSIKGATRSSVQAFRHVISMKGNFGLAGSTELSANGCRKDKDQYKIKTHGNYGGRLWIMECFEPIECDIVEFQPDLLKLKPISKKLLSKDRFLSRTVILPLDAYNESSYTFLPSESVKDILFVTDMLSGCSFFVAASTYTNCNLIVIHTNYDCSKEPSTNVDYNHQQAMAVLEELKKTNNNCRYQIYRRWAVDHSRSAIEAARYDYDKRVFYYSLPSFLYGYHTGGIFGFWQFCIKAVQPNPPTEECFQILEWAFNPLPYI